MAATRARAALTGLVLVVCASLSPAGASLPEPQGLTDDALAGDDLLELLRETAVAALATPELPAHPAGEDAGEGAVFSVRRRSSSGPINSSMRQASLEKEEVQYR